MSTFSEALLLQKRKEFMSESLSKPVDLISYLVFVLISIAITVLRRGVRVFFPDRERNQDRWRRRAARRKLKSSAKAAKYRRWRSSIEASIGRLVLPLRQEV